MSLEETLTERYSDDIQTSREISERVIIEEEVFFETTEKAKNEDDSSLSSVNIKSLSFGFIGFNETWDDIENWYAKILSIDEEKVVVDCLVDKNKLTFQTRIFSKFLFEDLSKPVPNEIVIIKTFKRKGKSTIVVKDAPSTAFRELFDNIPEFNELDSIPYKAINMKSF